MRRSKIIFGCVLLVLLSGCVSLLPEAGPAPKLYSLNPAHVSAASTSLIPLHLIVEKPFTYHYLDNAKIVLYEKEDEQLGNYTFIRGREWVERLPSLLHAQVIEGLEKTRLFKTVSRPEIAEEADIILHFEIRNFEITLRNNQASAHICLAAKILRATDQHILASHNIDVLQPADGKHFTSLMHAFDQGWEKALTDIIQWMTTLKPAISKQ